MKIHFHQIISATTYVLYSQQAMKAYGLFNESGF